MTRTPKIKAARPDFSQIGSTGLRQFGGFIAEEFLPALSGAKGAKVYREMADNDPTVGAVLFAITTLIRQSKWTVQAVDDSEEAELAKAFLEEVLADMEAPLSTVMAEITSMFAYGFAPMEIIWKRRLGRDHPSPEGRSEHDDGRIGVRNISLRAQPTVVRWDIDDASGDIIGFWQQPWSGPQRYVPIDKVLLFRTTSDRNNPEGRSILRTAYRPYYFKKKIEEIEAVGIERDMAGLPVAHIPSRYFDPSGDPADKLVMAEWQRLVTTIRRDQREGVVLPSDRDQSGNLLFELKLLSTAGSRTFDTTKIVDRYDRAIATSVLADFIFLGQQAVGSFALSSDKTALFATAIGAFTSAIADTLNRSLVDKLWRYNGMDQALKPTIVPGDLEHINLGELADYLTSLAGAGAQLFPDRELENHLRGIAGLPPAPEDGEDDMGFGEPENPDDADAPGQQAKNPDETDDEEASVAKGGQVTIHKQLVYDDNGLLTGIIETKGNKA